MGRICETPGQSVVAAITGGLGGGILGLWAGVAPLSAVVLAGVLGGCADLGAHLLRRDEQFQAAVASLRE